MSSYAHHILRLELFGDVIYRLTWTVDHKYLNSRSRFPRIHTRDTDEAGARRFAKKWRVASVASLAANTRPLYIIRK